MREDCCDIQTRTLWTGPRRASSTCWRTASRRTISPFQCPGTGLVLSIEHLILLLIPLTCVHQTKFPACGLGEGAGYCRAVNPLPPGCQRCVREPIEDGRKHLEGRGEGLAGKWCGSSSKNIRAGGAGWWAGWVQIGTRSLLLTSEYLILTTARDVLLSERTLSSLSTASRTGESVRVVVLSESFILRVCRVRLSCSALSILLPVSESSLHASFRTLMHSID